MRSKVSSSKFDGPEASLCVGVTVLLDTDLRVLGPPTIFEHAHTLGLNGGGLGYFIGPPDQEHRYCGK